MDLQLVVYRLDTTSKHATLVRSDIYPPSGQLKIELKIISLDKSLGSYLYTYGL